MAKILHTADLHITDGEEKNYCYGVLDEIIALAAAERADALVLAGDLFDSFGDFEALRKEVCRKFEPLAATGCRVIYIPGNHEARGSQADLSAYNLDPVLFCAARPFSLVEAGDAEFLCVPHADSYDGYRDWKVPPKQSGLCRVAVVHALNSSIYSGPEEETDSRTGVMDEDIFARFGVDYAAFGHVHSGRQQTLGGVVACYPGSPRVWRAHPREAGQKSVCLVETSGAGVSVRVLPLKAAGEYREYSLPLDLAGALAPAAVEKLLAAAGALDLVAVSLTGVVEDENAAKASAEKLREGLAGRCRLARVTLDTVVAAALSSNALARAFLAEMDKLEPEQADAAGYRRWLLARQYGLEELAARAGEAA
ncbi:MAG: metallophosphoesterase [Elusimicrobiales bacterium]|nr:metallophosphoesterase [Elusimicrobiales bacterium]